MSVSVSIIEDDVPAREILADWIRRAEGFNCASEHDDAESALEILPQKKPAVVLVDINLPGVNGIECIRRLKPVLPDTQFVMLTVYEDDNHIFRALSAGASGYLLKQTQRQMLLAALKEVHAGGSPMSSNIARKVVQSFRRAGTSAEGAAELSPREQEVLELLARGFLYKEIADSLGLSVQTVNTYIRRIYEKLHVRSRAQALAVYAHLPIGDER
ncbi:MAG TPA: response regulator transcription factor [Verrucomicrobiae bacterium]|nr:response regulator transcription factor [Verrucomicrobiae bacterium]